jgi:hypothetical protein
MPVGFHFSIWTDVPKDKTDFYSFSHPGEKIWEYTCTDYTTEFVGFDRDPRDPNATDGDDHVTWWPMIHDACYKFDGNIPEADWFHQEPNTPWGGRVHWLSIAAIYPPDEPPIFPWGWKTRPHNFNDDAVRIYDVQSGIWPPQIGDQWLSGVPIEYPRWVSWDLAFDLTTNQDCDPTPAYNPDFDNSGVINVIDLAGIAQLWLSAFPVP